MEAAEAVHVREAEIFVEKSLRDALAEQYHAEAKAEKKFEEDMTSIKYKEAQVKMKCLFFPVYILFWAVNFTDCWLCSCVVDSEVEVALAEVWVGAVLVCVRQKNLIIHDCSIPPFLTFRGL